MNTSIARTNSQICADHDNKNSEQIGASNLCVKDENSVIESIRSELIKGELSGESRQIDVNAFKARMIAGQS